MSRARAALAAALASSDAGSGHLSAEDLIAYQRGHLDPEAADQAQLHLVACAECARRLLDLEDLFGTEEPPLSELELAAVWRDLAPRLARRSPPLLRGRSWGRHAWPALAAALLAATVGLSWWSHDLATRLRESAEPQANSPVLDLFATRSRSAGAGSETPGTATLALPAGVRWLTLVLNPERKESFGDYGVEIRAADGGLVWSGRGLVKNAFGSFTLGLPRQRLPAGPARLRLFGLDAERRVTLGEYALEVAPP